MNNHQPLDDNTSSARRGPSRKYPWAILVVLILFVVIPFLAWYGSWFGRPLSDAKMEEYLHDQNKPRNVQHALAQIGNRVISGDQSVKRWYSDVINASHHQQPEVRLTAAWVMGQDNTYQDFHSALLSLLQDPAPGVRHNAALGLVRFGDASARPELIAMLQPFIVKAESAGSVELIVKEEGAPVVANAPLARIREPEGTAVVIRSSESGRVETISVANRARVESGSELMTLSPSTEQVWEALRALYIVGQPEDLSYVQRYTRSVAAMPNRIERQAIATIEAIRERATTNR